MSDLKLTPPETLLVWRRRAGYNQYEAAQHHGVTVNKYRRWEAGYGPSPRAKNLGELKDHEKCVIARRRSGKTQDDLAKDLNLSRLWIIEMEKGNVPADRLVEYWEL